MLRLPHHQLVREGRCNLLFSGSSIKTILSFRHNLQKCRRDRGGKQTDRAPHQSAVATAFSSLASGKLANIPCTRFSHDVSGLSLNRTTAWNRYFPNTCVHLFRCNILEVFHSFFCQPLSCSFPHWILQFSERNPSKRLRMLGEAIKFICNLSGFVEGKKKWIRKSALGSLWK